MKTIYKRVKRIPAVALIAALICCLEGCGFGAETSLDAEGSFSVSDETSDQEEANEDEGLDTEEPEAETDDTQEEVISTDDIPEYSGDAYVVINGNEPFFDESDLTVTSYESYSELDSLGRCGEAMACIGTDLMPDEERESISSVYPTGWHSVSYDFVDGNYLYNRCHLIGYQLSGENANEENLITGTRYLNVEGMLPFENMVADYVKETGNHVLYRVTPIFEGDNLVASGVLMEAESVEDEGESILFNVYVYNVQPGVIIDYATGDSEEDGDYDDLESSSGDESSSSGDTGSASADEETEYILNTNTMKFHYPDCSSVSRMSESNKEEYTGTRDDVIAMGYEPCGNCNP